jgi:hypothetical protein
MFSYANVTTLYVSAERGNNSYTGVHYENDKTLNGPLPSIDAALRIIGEMRRVGYMQPVTVKLMDEEYVLSRPITIRTAEKGFHDPAQVRDVTFESFGEKKTLISGGKRLEGFVPDTFNGHDCWSLELEDVKEGKWKFTDLYVNGLPAARTRYPSEGYLYPEDVDNKTPGTHNPSKWFIASEGFSILENVASMGVPIPEILKQALEIMRKKGEVPEAKDEQKPPVSYKKEDESETDAEKNTSETPNE